MVWSLDYSHPSSQFAFSWHLAPHCTHSSTVCWGGSTGGALGWCQAAFPIPAVCGAGFPLPTHASDHCAIPVKGNNSHNCCFSTVSNSDCESTSWQWGTLPLPNLQDQPFPRAHCTEDGWQPFGPRDINTMHTCTGAVVASSVQTLKKITAFSGLGSHPHRCFGAFTWTRGFLGA